MRISSTDAAEATAPGDGDAPLGNLKEPPRIPIVGPILYGLRGSGKNELVSLLDPDQLAVDRRRVEAYCRDHGYYDARVTDARVTPVGPGQVDVVIQVEEGELHHRNRLAEQGTPTMGLYDQRGKARIRLGLTADGAPVMRLLDKDGTVRALVGLASDESPFVQFMDEDGTVLVAPGEYVIDARFREMLPSDGNLRAQIRALVREMNTRHVRPVISSRNMEVPLLPNEKPGQYDWTDSYPATSR